MKKNGQYDVVCFGEILWDVLPSGARPGGAPMNVAYHLQKLGVQAALISRVGKDHWGEELINKLSDNLVTTAYVQVDETHPTGIVNATVGANNEVSYDIVHPVAWDFIKLENNILDLVASAHFFVFGSLVGRGIYSRKTLLELAGCAQTKVVDINLRPPHFDKQFIENLLAGAAILKLNEHELPLISSWFHSLKDSSDQLRWIQDKFSIPVVVVTKGGQGAMMCNQGNISKHDGFQVEVADTVGSGDAFLAGFIYMNRKQEEDLQCLAFANAMGAFMASKNGACPNYQVEQVHQLLQKKSSATYS